MDAPRTAKLVGLLYIVQMALAVFGQSFVRDRLLVTHDAVQTAANLTRSEQLFRLSIVTDLLTYTCVITLVCGLYIILRSVNSYLVLLAAFLRLVENAVLAVTTLNAFIALRLLSGEPYLQPLKPASLQALARMYLGSYGSGLSIGFVFCGFGSALFSYVWLQSAYIPRVIAVWGIFSSLLLSVGTLAIMVAPSLGAVGITYMLPMGVYEVGLGIWLLTKGIKLSPNDDSERI